MDRINIYDYKIIVNLAKKNKDKLDRIRMSDKCFGDKAREVIKQGITNNIVFARKLINGVVAE